MKQNYTFNEMQKCIRDIINIFGVNFENGSFNIDNCPFVLKEEPYKTEKYLQTLFNLILSMFKFLTIKEAQFGNGIVDILIWNTIKDCIVIELKLSSNKTSLYSPFDQIRDYMRRCNSQYGIFILFLVNKNTSITQTKEEYYNDLTKKYLKIENEEIEFYIIDGRKKKTPSEKAIEK